MGRAAFPQVLPIGWRAALGLESRRQWCAAAALAAFATAGLVVLAGGTASDDPYITYRYASNLLSGQGLVYNVGQRALSTTAPLYAILLAGLGLFGLDLPSASTWIGAGSLVACAGTLAFWARSAGQPLAGLLAGLFLGLSPSLYTTIGAETCLFLFLLLAGLLAYRHFRLTSAALALALAAMLRPEGVLAGVLVGLHLAVRRRPVPGRAAGLYLGLLAAWFLGLWLYFGSPAPLTLLAKQQQARMASATTFWSGTWNLARAYWRQPWYALHFAAACVGVVAVARRARHWGLLLAWTAIYFLGLGVLRVSSYAWYAGPLVPAYAVLVAEGAAAVARALAARFPRPAASLVVSLWLVAAVAPLLWTVLALPLRSTARMDLHREIGLWLREHTPPDVTVAALEIGAIGYHSGRRLVDFAGLLDPEVARQLPVAGSYVETAAWTLQRRLPQYVALDSVDFEGMVAGGWFRDHYAPVREFSRDSGSFTLYRSLEMP